MELPISYEAYLALVKSHSKSHVESYSHRRVIGWREWVSLPELGIANIKAKIDTGARTSALHAYDIEEFVKNRKPWVRFTIHPQQRNNNVAILAEAKIVDNRHVKDSGGRVTRRPVISTKVQIGDECLEIELTLVDRSEMGFRMLIGRAAVKGDFLVHPRRSYLLSTQPPKAAPSKTRKKVKRKAQ